MGRGHNQTWGRGRGRHKNTHEQAKEQAEAFFLRSGVGPTHTPPSSPVPPPASQAYLDQNFPPPVRYLIALTVPAKGASSLVLWKPLPPTPDFVALGMVATAHPADAKEPKPPPYDAVRCVPKAWARKAAAPEVAWQGSAGTVWRTRHNLVVGAKGRQPPPMYELPRDTFSSDSPNPP